LRRRLRRTVLISLLLGCAAPLAGTAAIVPADAGPHSAVRVPQLVARPAAVKAGGTLTLEGRGFAGNARITLLAGPLRHTPTRIGSAIAGLHGRFLATIGIRAHAAAHAFLAVACQDACRVKASARFRIVTR